MWQTPVGISTGEESGSPWGPAFVGQWQAMLCVCSKTEGLGGRCSQVLASVARRYRGHSYVDAASCHPVYLQGGEMRNEASTKVIKNCLVVKLLSQSLFITNIRQIETEINSITRTQNAFRSLFKALMHIIVILITISCSDYIVISVIRITVFFLFLLIHYYITIIIIVEIGSQVSALFTISSQALPGSIRS